MPNIEDIFSLRIVTVDFYMEKPKAGLDPCFSEFRAKEIKKVPIIRIFGASKEGQKTCMHVHGIFPYLYIPYDKNDFESIDKAVYLVASSIDKAINISLGQGSSSSIHVFKVQLVKGIPFYGYHKREHQYLKIYMLNPRFIRRTANLLQNGAIMNKIFQPHESHVPYILQFFIDYNLYGMSFLHVPRDILKFRRKDENDIIPFAVEKEQILDCAVAEKQSVSQLEVDIASGFILNRFQVLSKASEHSNPGIESIWHDERVRREKLSKDCEEVPPLETPASQERPDVKPTESDQFYRVGLVNKLQQAETSMNDTTINTTMQTSVIVPEKSIKEKKRTFNLQKLIANSVYPEECTQDDVLTNASCIEDHLLNRSVFHASMKLSETPTSSNPDDVFLDDTIVDEDLVLSLTQPDAKNQTLREEDMELLDVMQQLEDKDSELLDVMQQLEEREGENEIDLDSTLAPLSQNIDLNASDAGLDMSVGLAGDSRKETSENEEINDFSVALDDMEELLLKLSQNSQPSEPGPSMAQVDGADDIMKTPTKNAQRKLPGTPKTPTTPRRTSMADVGSPRTPKSLAKKYAPLPLVIQSGSLKKKLSTPNDKQIPPVTEAKELETSEQRDGSYTPSTKSLQSLRKKLALTELRRKSISTDSEPQAANANLTKSKRRKTIDLDKTHITCSLRVTRSRAGRALKTYESNDVEESESTRAQDMTEVTQPSIDPSSAMRSSTSKTETEARVRLRAGRASARAEQILTGDSSSLECATGKTGDTDRVTLSEDGSFTTAGGKQSPTDNSPDMVSTTRKFGGTSKVRLKADRASTTTEVSQNGAVNSAAMKSSTSKTEVAPRMRLRADRASTTTEGKQSPTGNSPDMVSTASKTEATPRVRLRPERTSEVTRTLTKASEGAEVTQPPTDSSPATGSTPSQTEANLRLCLTADRASTTTEVTENQVDKSTAMEFVTSKSEARSLGDPTVTSPDMLTNTNKTEATPRVRLSKSPHIKELLLEKTIKTEPKTPKPTRKLSLKSHRKILERRAARFRAKSSTEEESPRCDVKKETTAAEMEDKYKFRRSLVVKLKKQKISNDEKPPTSAPVSPKTPTVNKRADSNEPRLQPVSSDRRKNITVDLKKVKVEYDSPVEKKPFESPRTPQLSATPDRPNRRYSTHVDKFKMANLPTPRTPKCSQDLTEIESDDDNLVHSFYESSFIVDSPVFSELSVPSPVTNAQIDKELSPSAGVVITATLPRETREQIRQNCRLYEIPEVINQQPFYSNFADVTQRKEVGHFVLSIPGNTVNDLEEFRSSIPDLQGLSSWRKKLVQTLGIQFRNEAQIREYFATEKPVAITSSLSAPTRRDAKVWLKARQLHRDLKEKASANVEEDSPIKIRRQKVAMIMENESGESGEDMDCSVCSLSLTPLTPADVTRSEVLKSRDPLDHTPLTGGGSSRKSERGARPLKARVSLSQKLKDICISNAMEKGNSQEPGVSREDALKAADLGVVSASQESAHSNDSVTTELALAELDRSSFVKNLQSSQGSLETSFGLSAASLNNTFGFKVNLENLQQAKSDIEHNYLTTLSLEVFVPTREDLHPNPQFDSILCFFYVIENSVPSEKGTRKSSGFIIVADDPSDTKPKFNGIESNLEVQVVPNELEGLCKLLEFVGHWDPDIFVGYEIEMASWGYVMERAKHLDLNIGPLLSRIPSQKVRDFIDEDRDQFTDLDVETKLCGRILLDVWRLMRSEIALTSYTFENVMYHILHRRCPRHTFKDLTQWFAAPQTRWIVLEYYMERVNGTMELLDQLDLIGRTSEMAKLIGIQFYEVLSRGSQFRVESMMLRIAKPKNLVPLSPSVQQRAHMRAPEYLPLILEPQSRFYADPVIVLDFQSLYPSMIMAYNYCFSTCLGRVEHLGTSIPFEFGASQLRVSATLLRKLLQHDLVNISPCGVVYIKREVREGILPRMLSEILDTRQMVKQSMKLHKNNSALQRILHSRQLGLKLMANVTYGYTAANFSGRMPCVEVGDSVVAKGRETLERAIKMVNANDKWNVRVVYGDTDSLFVMVPGRNRAEAFRIGAEIAEAVTQDNPQPVKLKLEKVYQPCILQTKKRYVGYMYETPDQEKPEYEAKGIETVRRDGCPAVAKMLEKCLKILFDSADVSQVKSYVCRQFTKLLSGKANLQDLIFAKEFRGMNGYKPTACVPALELTRKWLQTDPLKIPRRGERVPFIITNGPPGVPLIKLVRSPHEVLADEGLKINAIYYITKAIIPPLNRCFLLIGADVNEWFTNLPRKILFTPALSTANEIISTTTGKKSTISQYFSSTNCIIDCGRQTKQGICTNCVADTSKSLTTLQSKIFKLERGYHLTQMICQACCGRSVLTHCSSLDCPVLYVLEMKRRDLTQISHIENLVTERFPDKKCV